MEDISTGLMPPGKKCSCTAKLNSIREWGGFVILSIFESYEKTGRQMVRRPRVFRRKQEQV